MVRGEVLMAVNNIIGWVIVIFVGLIFFFFNSFGVKVGIV